MRIGLHLPQFTSDETDLSLSRLLGFIDDATRAGFRLLATNDNLVFPSEAGGPQRPWIDGPSLLALAASRATDSVPIEAFSLALPLHRGVAMTARTLASLSQLFGGRLTVALAPGSSALGHRLAGIDTDTLWPQIEAATRLVRRLLGHGPLLHRSLEAEAEDPGAVLQAAEQVGRLRSSPSEPSAPPVWLASWGSSAGLRRIARCADGWLASAYALPVEELAARRSELVAAAEQIGRDPATLRTGVATTFVHIAESESSARSVLEERLAPKLSKDPAVLQDRVLIGTRDQVVERLHAFSEAGADVLLLAPVLPTGEQLEQVAEAAGVVAGQMGERNG